MADKKGSTARKTQKTSDKEKKSVKQGKDSNSDAKITLENVNSKFHTEDNPSRSEDWDTPGSSKSKYEKTDKRKNEDGMVAYIQNLSPLKKSKRNITYSKMNLQTRDNTYEAVSFKQEARKLFENASSQKSPVKLLNFKKTANIRDNSKVDIQIGKQTVVVPLDETTFKFQEIETEIPEHMDVKSLLQNGYDRQLVSVIGTINDDGCYETQFGPNSWKKDVFLSDATGSIQLTLWNEFMPNKGTFDISNVQVRFLPTLDQPIISTSSITKFESHHELLNVHHPSSSLFEVLSFPIAEFNMVSSNPKCSKCHHSASPSNTNFYKCTNCGLSMRYSDLDMQKNILVKFPSVESTITIFQYQKQLYCNHFTLDMQDDDEVTESFLRDDSTKMVINKQKYCVTFLF